MGHTKRLSTASATALEHMRRAIAGGYPSCRNGDACHHPDAATCECLQTAVSALDGLTSFEPAIIDVLHAAHTA